MPIYNVCIFQNGIEAENEDDAFNEAYENLNSMSPDEWAAEITEEDS